jgi:hypothetical protein
MPKKTLSIMPLFKVLLYKSMKKEYVFCNMTLIFTRQEDHNPSQTGYT